MSITSAIVLFAVIWFMVLFILLPVGLRTQGDEGEIVPGTHAGSPARTDMWRKARTVTWVSAILWALIAGFILFSGYGVRDIDWFNRMDPVSEAGETDG
ncbi:Predicted secreted protein [Palleronia salina]|uniref:Predicted secreted protein n=2 Tax=Palleronia TaxID=315422 RepID=A0A1M6LEZ3_9RHOB|nr:MULTISPECIES: DUF1467 family protein [Palleronia]SEO04282.1 Predicted secreted protein [Palleronia pelagia]SHJ69732.1 Predicted secreted protein [Palleronia salina]